VIRFCLTLTPLSDFVPQSPFLHISERLNEPAMSHDDFVIGYQNGRLGSSVSTVLVLQLFLVGRIRERRLAISLVGWALGLLLLVGLSSLAFLRIPAPWAILGTIITFAVFLLGFSHQLSGLVVSAALTNKQFYELAMSQHALRVTTDGEVNLPRLPKIVPMQPSRRAQR
jgi:hypothetical protein